MFLDERLLAGVGAGLTQVVVLAAALDDRAYRLPWPTSTVVYELDKSDVLAFKNKVARRAALPPATRLVTVPADLTGDWRSPLRATGFTPNRPTLWLLEGILGYPGPAQADRLLAEVSRVSAPGSRLLAVYAVGVTVEAARRAGRDGADDVAALARLMREGPPAAPDAWFPRHGWHVEASDIVTWAEQVGRSPPPGMDPAQGGAVCHLVEAGLA